MRALTDGLRSMAKADGTAAGLSTGTIELFIATNALALFGRTLIAFDAIDANAPVELPGAAVGFAVALESTLAAVRLCDEAALADLQRGAPACLLPQGALADALTALPPLALCMWRAVTHMS